MPARLRPKLGRDIVRDPVGEVDEPGGSGEFTFGADRWDPRIEKVAAESTGAGWSISSVSDHGAVW